MSSIYKALEEGYSPEDIINYFSKAIPSVAEPIRKATKAGYTIQQILGYLSKSFDTEDRRGMSETERHAANRRSDSAMTKYGLKMAASAVVAPLAARAASSALSRAVPNSLKKMINPVTGQLASQQSGVPGSPELNDPSNQNAMNPLQSASGPILGMPQGKIPKSSVSSTNPSVEGNTISQPTEIKQPEVKTIDVSDVINKNPAKNQIDKLIASGNGPEEISAFYQKFNPKVMKQIEKESGQPFGKVVEDYISKNPMQEKELQPQEIEEPRRFEKSSIVSSPQGIGEVLEVRNGKALIEVDGKRHQVDEDELIQSPLPEKDLADLYDDVIAGIEKETGQQVSRNVEWSGYDAGSNELAYKPHGSESLYVYDDISPEDVEILTSLLTKRKSTGENYIGAWEKGTTSPIGAAMYQLIKKLQSERGGKGNEYKNKYATIYDALEVAKTAAKRKHAERKKKAKKPRAT